MRLEGGNTKLRRGRSEFHTLLQRVIYYAYEVQKGQWL